MPEPPPTPDESRRTRRTRRTRRLRRLWTVPAVLVAGAFALFLLRSSLVAGSIERTLGRELAARARIAECELAPAFDRLELRGVELFDLEGHRLAAVRLLDLRLQPVELLSRRGRTTLHVEDLELRLWRTPDGVWNWSELVRDEPAPEPGSTGGSGGGDEPSSGDEADLELTVVLAEARVVELAGPDSTEVLRRWEGDLEARVRFTEDARGARRLDLTSLELASEALRGTLAAALVLDAGGAPAVLESSTGEFTLAPHELARLAGAEPPAELDPASRPRLAFDVSGPLGGDDALALVRGLSATAQLQLEGLTLAGLDLAGTIDLTQRNEVVRTTGEFAASGGRLTLDAIAEPYRADPDPERPAKLVVDAKDVPVTEEARRLFSFVHPAFAALDDLEDATVGGRADANILLSWAAPVPWAQLTEDPAEVDLAPLSGTGSLAVNDVVVQGSELLRRMREELDDDPDGELRLRELRFVLADGRLRYDRPWTWTIGSTETSFTGSVGLDRTIDLSWNVPVTARLAERYRFLRKLEGRRLDVPVSGTVSDPRIEFTGLVGEVAGSLLDQVLPGSSTDASGEGPEALLRRADELWAAGDREPAAALYRRIREEHKLSLVYTLNRSRVKERAAWRPSEPPD